MNRLLTLTAVVVTGLFGSACGDGNGVDTKGDSVDRLLAKVCEMAAGCPGSSATQSEIDDCPLGIRGDLDQSDLAELEQFATYPRAKQDKIIECVGVAICDRFSGRLTNISDSDVMEPYRECVVTT
jgi:hypothetical protein